jgi:hypothetical protein
MILPVTTPSEVTPDLTGRIVTATGHRCNKLPGGYSREARVRLRDFASRWLEALRPRGICSGMAIGWDLAVADACVALGIPFVACVPFAVGQESRWPAESQDYYRSLLARAAKVIVCSPGGYAPAKMQARNERMVNIAMRGGAADPGLILALWSGTAGGTKNCLDYARIRQCPAVNAWADLINGYAAAA